MGCSKKSELKVIPAADALYRLTLGGQCVNSQETFAKNLSFLALSEADDADYLESGKGSDSSCSKMEHSNIG